jgi:hypothetical protein
MSDKQKKFYYYASERGCMKDPNSVDAIGVGIDGGDRSCTLSINLIRFQDRGSGPRFTMEVSAHSDEWNVFSECRDVLDLLAKKAIRYPNELNDTEPFYALRIHLEKLGYANLGVLTH